MSIEVVNKIESLPPLPKTITELNEFKNKLDKEPEELLQIIEKDALIIATLLKISNSAMFGFRSKVETPSRAINLLGVDFTLSVAISSIVNNLIKTDLKPYGATNDDFMESSTTSTSLVNIWLSQIDENLRDELILPALLQNAGKFIISDIVEHEGKLDLFKDEIQNGKDESQIEKELVGYSTAEITAMIFQHWKLSPHLIELIKNVDNLDECEEDVRKKAQILNITKTVCSLVNNLSDEHVELALKKAKEYGLDETILKQSIDKLKEKILDAM